MSIRQIDAGVAQAEGGTSGGRFPLVWVAAAVTGVIAVGAIVVGLSQLGDAPAPGPAPTATAEAPRDGAALTPHSGEVPGVPGLLQGTATVEWGNSDALYGVPIAWPRDVDGAIGAAMNYSGASLSLVGLLPDTRADLAERIYSPEGREVSMLSDEQVAGIRASLGIDELGNVVRDGAVVEGERAFGQHFPRFGAYRVIDVETDAGGQPTRVDVEVWFPSIAGTGTTEDLDGVHVGWVTWDVGMTWFEGDWRIYAIAVDVDQPVPAETRRTNQPWPTVRSLLGPGWAVPADGTDQHYPGAVLTR